MAEFDNPEAVPQADFDAAIAAIKAIHAAGGRKLSESETIEFVTRPIYLGPPKRLKPKGVGRGPQSRDNQYDKAVDRRKLIFHKLVRNPRSSIKAAQKTQPMRDRIIFFATGLSKKVSRSKRVTAVLDRLNAHGHYPSRSTVQRVLRKLDVDF
jgi:hypothetical protein